MSRGTRNTYTPIKKSPSSLKKSTLSNSNSGDGDITKGSENTTPLCWMCAAQCPTGGWPDMAECFYSVSGGVRSTSFTLCKQCNSAISLSPTFTDLQVVQACPRTAFAMTHSIAFISFLREYKTLVDAVGYENTLPPLAPKFIEEMLLLLDNILGNKTILVDERNLLYRECATLQKLMPTTGLSVLTTPPPTKPQQPQSATNRPDDSGLLDLNLQLKEVIVRMHQENEAMRALVQWVYNVVEYKSLVDMMCLDWVSYKCQFVIQSYSASTEHVGKALIYLQEQQRDMYSQIREKNIEIDHMRETMKRMWVDQYTVKASGGQVSTNPTATSFF